MEDTHHPHLARVSTMDNYAVQRLQFAELLSGVARTDWTDDDVRLPADADDPNAPPLPVTPPYTSKCPSFARRNLGRARGATSRKASFGRTSTGVKDSAVVEMESR